MSGKQRSEQMGAGLTLSFTKQVPKFLQKIVAEHPEVQEQQKPDMNKPWRKGEDGDDDEVERDDEAPLIVTENNEAPSEEILEQLKHQKDIEKDEKERRIAEIREKEFQERIKKKRLAEIEAGKKVENPDVRKPILFSRVTDDKKKSAFGDRKKSKKSDKDKDQDKDKETEKEKEKEHGSDRKRAKHASDDEEEAKPSGVLSFNFDDE